MKTVVVGLSGGVDSSVAAYLLKEEGYNVIGIFMKNWHDESVTISDECPWIDDSQDALLVADKLGIPFQVLDLSDAYKDRIVNYMFSEYKNGRTPNPDILCNREIKFDVFLNAAKDLGADFVATGHYCRKETDKDGNHRLLAGKDNNKDQSYFLCQLTQDQLANSLFPIGDLQKSEVRKIAAACDFITADKKDSQGLCFVGKVKLPTFLQQKLAPKDGNIIKIPNKLSQYNAYQEALNKKDFKASAAPFSYNESDGEIVGKHNGAHYYTVGQRKGLGVGGMVNPLFVIATNTTTNSIYVGEGEKHPGLNRKVLFIEEKDIHWIRKDLKLENTQNSLEYKARVRYRQELLNIKLFKESEGLYILFDDYIKGIAPGQFAAWYKNDELIGSGIINA